MVDAENFLNSDLGRYLIECADMEIQSAKDELATIPYWRKRKIIALQNKIQIAASVPNWLKEVISNGRNAEQLLDEQLAD